MPFLVQDSGIKRYPQCELIIGLGLMDYLSDDQVLKIFRQISKLNCKFIFSFSFKCTKSYIRFIYRSLSGTKIFLRSPEEISKKILLSGINKVNIISEKLGASVVVHNF